MSRRQTGKTPISAIVRRMGCVLSVPLALLCFVFAIGGGAVFLPIIVGAYVGTCVVGLFLQWLGYNALGDRLWGQDAVWRSWRNGGGDAFFDAIGLFNTDSMATRTAIPTQSSELPAQSVCQSRDDGEAVVADRASGLVTQGESRARAKPGRTRAQAPSPALFRPQESPLAESLKALKEHPAAVAVSLLMCFPFGLCLVWSHSRWSQRQKVIWTVGFVGVVVLGLVMRKAEEANLKNTLVEANRAWDAGQEVEALGKYRSLLDNKNSVLDSDRPTIYQRIIEHEIEQGNTSDAKALIERALDQRIPLALKGEADRLLGKVKMERVSGP